MNHFIDILCTAWIYLRRDRYRSALMVEDERLSRLQDDGDYSSTTVNRRRKIAVIMGDLSGELALDSFRSTEPAVQAIPVQAMPKLAGNVEAA